MVLSLTINAIFCIFIAFLSCSTAENVTSSQFQFRIQNSAVDCAFVYNENYYDSSHVLTTTSPDYWSYTGSAWDLKYNRVDESHAVGGRCETPTSGALQGSGKFSASLYIHSSVASSDGVFTLGILNRHFDQSGEIDLIVVNINENTVKSGRPESAFSIDMGSVSNRWIDVVMTKSGDRCSTTVYSNGNVLFDPQGSTHGCGLNEDGGNYFVVNSRSRGGPYSSSSFVTVASASWE